MKTNKLKSSLLSGIISLLFIFPCLKTQSLKEIARPYLGEYVCQSATLGGKDLLQNANWMLLLKADGHFLLVCKGKNETRREEGEYHYHFETQTISFEHAQFGGAQREFPLRNGKICISVPLRRQMLRLVFVHK